MRRVSVSKAKAGMVLGRAVYDIQGHLLLAREDKLTEEGLGLLARSGSSEILIEDPRVADVLVGSLFSAQMEAKAIQGLRVLLVTHEGTTDLIGSNDIIGIQPPVKAMMQRLSPDIMGDPDLSGFATLQGYDYVHPVKVAGLAMLIGRYTELGPEDSVRLEELIQYLPNTLGYGVRASFVCGSCETQGLVGSRVTCTQCGTETWVGWWPEAA